MQIKRFEAADMTEALRLVKREFGEDAVILSAKEVKPKGFFSALKKRHVEITAATDYPSEEAAPNKEFTGLLAQQLDEITSSDRVTLSAASPRIAPVPSNRRPDIGPQRLADPGFNDDGHEGRKDEPQPSASKEAAPVIADVRRRRRPQLDKDTFCTKHRRPEREWNGWIEKPFYSQGIRKQTIALVGPPGAGKSSALAKLAWRCQTAERQQVGVISLDRYRMAGNSLLARFTEIMKLPFYVVRDADELLSALKSLADTDTVLIDTPGMGPDDRSMAAAVSPLLSLAQPDETHLVVNATVQYEIRETAIHTFENLNPDHILFTHLDELGTNRTMLDSLGPFRLPCSFWADGINLYEDLKTADEVRRPSDRNTMMAAGGQVTVFPGSKAAGHMAGENHRHSAEPARYMANRNSELFHESTCKSVKRINVENIVAFRSIEQALHQGFKPCRACCKIDMIRKMTAADAGVQRARAM